MSGPDLPVAPAVVAVLGSCPTRDNFNSRFNPDYRAHYSCPLHQNQTSMISLMSEPLRHEWAPTGNMSEYDRWNVETEFDKSFLEEVRALRPDYLILDFFADIHFGCLRLPDGRFVTDNRWKVRKTDWYERLSKAGGVDRITIFEDTEQYLALWRESYLRFDAFVRKELPDVTLVVHRGHNVDLIRLPDRLRPARLQKHTNIERLDVPEANRLWRQLDDFAIETSGAQSIDLTGTAWTTYPEHPWGPFYVHYEPSYYHRFLAELHQIHLRKVLPASLAEMVTAIDAARAERAGVELDHRDQLLQRQRQRIKRLSARVGELETPWWSRWRRRRVRQSGGTEGDR